MTIQQWQAEFGPEVPKEVLFLGTSGLRMQHMVRENLVWGLSRVMGDYHFAEDCACDDTATDIYWGQLLAAANRLGHALTELVWRSVATTSKRLPPGSLSRRVSKICSGSKTN
jgi:hypothetical protein